VSGARDDGSVAAAEGAAYGAPAAGDPPQAGRARSARAAIGPWPPPSPPAPLAPTSRAAPRDPAEAAGVVRVVGGGGDPPSALWGSARSPVPLANEPGAVPAAGVPLPSAMLRGAPPAPPPQPASLTAGGVRLWRAGRWMLLLRGGPLRFRPFQCDLLHLDVWRDGAPFCADAGTGAYNPADFALWGTAAHNTVEFDGEEQMPRAGRFLLARWPRVEWLAEGAAVTDARGRRHERRVFREASGWRIEDRLSGPFRRATLRWRILDCRAALSVEADAPLTRRREVMPHSPRYGERRDTEGLACELLAPGSRFVTLIESKT